MKTIRIFLILLSGLITGCMMATPATKYYEALESESTVVFTSFPQLVSLPDIPMLETFEEEGAFHTLYELDDHDRMFEFAEYKSHFRLFRFDLEANEEFAVIVDAFALGVPHKMLTIIPRVVVLDSAGNALDMSKMPPDNKFAARLSPPPQGVALEGVSQNAGSYFLMVAADNSNIGAHVGSSTGTTAAGGLPMNVNMNEFSNPFGRFLANYEVLKDPAD